MAAMLRQLNFVWKGMSESTKAGHTRARARFLPEDDRHAMEGKTVLVTGANAGLGRAAATALAEKRATVLCVCRDAERGRKAVDEIIRDTGNERVSLRVCDIGDLESVGRLAEELKGTQLHVLVNNAGVLLNKREETATGLEASFAINTLGTYAVTERLLPHMEAAARDSNGAFVPRCITVTSGGMYSAPLEPSDFDPPAARAGRSFDGVKLYAMHKRQQVALTEHWDATYGASKGVRFVCMHPGWSDTPGVAKSLPAFRTQMEKSLRSPEEGADTIVWLACVPFDRLEGGEFYLDRAIARKHLPLSFGTTAHAPSAVSTLVTNLQSMLSCAGKSS